MPDELVLLRRAEVEELILQAHLRALKLTSRLLDDRDMAAFMGYTVESWQALVRRTPGLAKLAVTAGGTRRPRRRWPAWEIVPLLQEGQKRRTEDK